MSVKGLLESEKKAGSLQRQLDSSFNKQLRELRQELRKVEYLLGDKKTASMWANSPADPSRFQQLRSMLDETERLYLEAGNSRAARIFKERMEKQLRQRLTNLKANELEVIMRSQAHRAAAEKQMLSRLTSIKREGAARELYMQSRSAGGFISGMGRGFMQDLVTLETKAAGSKTIGEYMNNLYNQYEKGLKDVFVKGIIRGDSYKQMENNLMRATDITKGKARLLVRTEANAIFNESVREVIDDNPLVKGYRFRAVLDGRTSKTCQHMDGKYIPKEDVEPGVNFPPLHPNCRSTVTTVLVSENVKKDTTQRYTKNKNNEWVTVPPGMKYPEFKRIMGEFAETTAGVSRQPNISNVMTLKGQRRAVQDLLQRRESAYERQLPGVDVEKFVKGKLKGLVDNSQLRIRVPDTGVLEKILDEGFKNQMEVGESKGIFDNTLRKRLSGRLFGYDESEASDSDFEIYGYLHDNIDEDVDNGNLNLYGGIVVELKKENLRDRTTFTVGDSLDLSIYGREFESDPMLKRHGFGDKGDVANPAQLIRPSKIDDISSTAMTTQDIRRLYSPMYRDTTASNLKEFREMTPFGYFEAQYHGGVKASDIDSITFDEQSVVTKELFDKLKEKGIKVKGRRRVQEGIFTVRKVIEIDSYEEFIASGGSDRKVSAVVDGEVTALAGANSLQDNEVSGIAMGTSEAVGYVDRITTLNNHSEVVGRSMNERAKIYEQEMPGVAVEKIVKKVIGDVVDSSAFRTRLPDVTTLESIIDDRFRTQMELGKSSGVLDSSFRKEVSAALFGTDISTAKNSDYELYGYLGSKNMMEDYSNVRLRQYGDVIVEFKKENLKDRTTFTVGDSVNIMKVELGEGFADTVKKKKGPMIPSKVTDVKSTALDLRNVKDIVDLERANMGVSSYSPERLASALKVDYVEAQYHGGVAPTDIESVLIDGRTYMSPELYSKLKALDIKVMTIRSFNVVEIKEYADFRK